MGGGGGGRRGCSDTWASWRFGMERLWWTDIWSALRRSPSDFLYLTEVWCAKSSASRHRTSPAIIGQSWGGGGTGRLTSCVYIAWLTLMFWWVWKHKISKTLAYWLLKLEPKVGLHAGQKCQNILLSVSWAPVPVCREQVQAETQVDPSLLAEAGPVCTAAVLNLRERDTHQLLAHFPTHTSLFSLQVPSVSSPTFHLPKNTPIFKPCTHQWYLDKWFENVLAIDPKSVQPTQFELVLHILFSDFFFLLQSFYDLPLFLHDFVLFRGCALVSINLQKYQLTFINVTYYRWVKILCWGGSK